MTPAIPATQPSARVELALVHLAACRYRRQGLGCSTCAQSERALAEDHTQLGAPR